MNISWDGSRHLRGSRSVKKTGTGQGKMNLAAETAAMNM